MTASSNGHVEIVKLLLQAGADKEATSNEVRMSCATSCTRILYSSPVMSYETPYILLAGIRHKLDSTIPFFTMVFVPFSFLCTEWPNSFGPSSSQRPHRSGGAPSAMSQVG